MAQSSSLQPYIIKVFNISLMNKVLKGNNFLSEWAARIGRKALFSPGALLIGSAQYFYMPIDL
jgi:hypothetical protein